MYICVCMYVCVCVCVHVCVCMCVCACMHIACTLWASQKAKILKKEKITPYSDFSP